MHRIRGKVFGVAMAIAATGLLAACGDDDSTASSTPTLTTTATSAAAAPSSTEGEPSSPAPQAAEPEQPQPQPEQQPEQQPETVAPERPQPVPTEDIPEADTSGLSDKDKQFLATLGEKGIKPSSPDVALSVATYVCQGVSAGAAESDLTTFVNAMAGSDASFDPSKMSVEDAGRIYIDAAKQTYCQ